MKMKKILNGLNFAALGVIIFLMTGCGSPLMTSTDVMHDAENNYAIISFVRPSAFGGAIKFSLWDSENLIGILTAGSIIQYKATPGQHLFIARGENWSYVTADLKPGKHYFIEGKVFPGVWKARVGLAPIDANVEGYRQKAENWLSSLNPITMKPEAVDGYVTPRLDHIRQAIDDYNGGAVKFAVLEPDFAL